MTSRQIIHADLNRVEEIVPLFDAYRQFYHQPSNLGGARKFLAERLIRNESVIFLALENAQAVGFVQLYPSFTSVGMKRLWILNDLFVAPPARGRGIGTALLEESRRLAMKTGAKGLVLTTWTDNRQAQRIYEKSGWKRDELSYTYYLDV
jgi:ribosomal protein S18 acetylase RimI-like enzyme